MGYGITFTSRKKLKAIIDKSPDSYLALLAKIALADYEAHLASEARLLKALANQPKEAN